MLGYSEISHNSGLQSLMPQRIDRVGGGGLDGLEAQGA